MVHLRIFLILQSHHKLLHVVDDLLGLFWSLPAQLRLSFEIEDKILDSKTQHCDDVSSFLAKYSEASQAPYISTDSPTS